MKITGAPAHRAFDVTALIRPTTSSASNGAGSAQNSPVCTSITSTAEWSGTFGIMAPRPYTRTLRVSLS